MSTVTASTPLIGATGAFAGNNTSGSFIPTLWSAKLNQKFYKATVFGEIANTSYEGEISGIEISVTIISGLLMLNFSSNSFAFDASPIT